MQHDDTGSAEQASYAEQAARTNADTSANSPQPHGSQLDSGFTTNVNFENPGAPGGAGMLPSAGDLGALDPGSGGDIGGEDLAHQRGETTDFPATQQARHAGATPNTGDSEDSVSGGSSTSW